MTTTIYLVRHGEARSGTEKGYRTYPGYHLTTAGKKEARKVAEFFKNRTIDAIYSSPFFRTEETSQIIAKKLGISVVVDRALAEVPLKDKGDGETPEEVIARTNPLLNNILKNHTGGRVIIVTHQGVIDAIASNLVEGKPKFKYQGGAGLTSINELELDDNLELISHSYLDVDPST